MKVDWLSGHVPTVKVVDVDDPPKVDGASSLTRILFPSSIETIAEGIVIFRGVVFFKILTNILLRFFIV